MLHIKKLDDGLEVFKALGSELRLQILKLLLENTEMNMNELATGLGISKGTLTGHVKKLEEAGLIQVVEHGSRGGHGNQKWCRLAEDRIFVEIKLDDDESEKNICESEIKIGRYSNYEVWPTCGIATTESIIGEFDEPCYFAYPERENAGILWFMKGYVEYIVPHLIPRGTKIDEVMFSMELGSEAPGVNSEWPSEISFYLNDVKLGSWISSGDYGDSQGIFTPDWWPDTCNQYGRLKLLAVNRKGTFLEGSKISDVCIDQLHLDQRSPLRLKLQVLDDAKYVGGMTLFGKGFGNYDQGIRVRFLYSPLAGRKG